MYNATSARYFRKVYVFLKPQETVFGSTMQTESIFAIQCKNERHSCKVVNFLPVVHKGIKLLPFRHTDKFYCALNSAYE